MKILLIRHGETGVNQRGRMHATDDAAALTVLGQQQAQQAADICRREQVDVLWSSPATRATQTAEIISNQLHLPYEVHAELAERNWGEWSARTWSQIEPELAGLSLAERYRFRPPGGETWEEMDRRLVASLEQLRVQPDRCVAIVTHMGAMRALVPILDNLPKEASFKLAFANGEVVIRELDSSELPRGAARDE